MAEKLFEVRPRMEGQNVVVEVVKTDDGTTLAKPSFHTGIVAYDAAHALRDGLEEALEAAFQAGKLAGAAHEADSHAPAEDPTPPATQPEPAKP